VKWYSTSGIRRVEVSITLTEEGKEFVTYAPNCLGRCGRQPVSDYLDGERIDVTAGNGRTESRGFHER
jgi:hypothetical protein